MMQASSASSSIQQDDFRHNAEVEVAESGCSECVCGRSGSVPQKAEVNYNLRKRKHPAWMWLMLMQQLMALLLSLPAKTGSKRCGWRVLPVWMATVILLLPAGLALDVSSIPLPPPSDVVPRQPNESGICSSLDIRNSAEKLRELENCTVVEGFVNIVLIEEDKEAAGGRGSFAGHSYPNLREITGYLLLYRVYGLTSLKDLFPNLAVIRGQELFYDYSLVVYELMALKELGLRSLTYIQRGSVLIEKNPNLCYVESINWNQITVKGEHNFIHSNKKPSECRACPDRCPTSRNGNSRVCWNNELCQKVCPRDCQDRGLSCNVTTATREQENSQSSRSRHFCCHEQCAGGCSGPGSHQCHVCKNVAHNDDCLSMCPTSYYLHYERRCVTQQECVRMAYPPDRESHKSPWKPIEGNAVEKPQCRLVTSPFPPHFNFNSIYINRVGVANCGPHVWPANSCVARLS